MITINGAQLLAMVLAILNTPDSADTPTPYPVYVAPIAENVWQISNIYVHNYTYWKQQAIRELGVVW
jgi:hypothetical protein